MDIIKIFLQILIFFYCFFIRCDENIKIFDDDIKDYFGSKWVNNISKERDVILVKMDKKKTDDVDDYNSKYKCQRDFNYNRKDYRLIINVEKNHNLDYKILIKDKDVFRDVNDDEKGIFYRLQKRDTDGNVETIKNTKSLFFSKNWVLIRVKTHDNKEFYAFINNIFTYYDGKYGWGPLAYGSNFKELYIIYSNIYSIPWLTNTVLQTYYDFIDLKGLNFEDNGAAVDIRKWFTNAKNLKKIKNIPNFIEGILMSKMLDGCESLEDVDLGENTIILANNCFENCKNLKNVNLKNVKIEEGANLSKMFLNCKNIKNIEGFKTFIKEKDTPNIENMLEGAEVDGELDLTLWGTNIIPKGMLKNGKVKSLKLFNLKKILQYYIEFCKKKIQKCEKEINDEEKDLEDYRKELEELNQKEPKTEDIRKEIKDLEESIKSTENYIKEKKDMIKQYQDEIDGNGKGLNILENSTIDELYIKEEFMPEDKKYLDKLVGNNCTVKMLYIVDKDGNCKKYKDFNDYKNNEEYKEPEQQDIPNNQQIPEDIKENEIPKGNTCLNCCGKCFSKCCCCCKRNV